MPIKTWVMRCPITAEGVLYGSMTSVEDATAAILARLNAQPNLLDPTRFTRHRDPIIRTRAAAGISQADLARQFGITYQRVHQIVHGRRT